MQHMRAYLIGSSDWAQRAQSGSASQVRTTPHATSLQSESDTHQQNLHIRRHPRSNECSYCFRYLMEEYPEDSCRYDGQLFLLMAPLVGTPQIAWTTLCQRIAVFAEGRPMGFGSAFRGKWCPGGSWAGCHGVRVVQGHPCMECLPRDGGMQQEGFLMRSQLSSRR